MNTETFTDENDIEKNNDNGETFELDDDDECSIEDIEDDGSDADSEEHRANISKMFRDVAGDDDEGNYNIHDQLPSVEEVKASNAYLPTLRLLAKGHRRKLFLTVAASALVAVLLSVTISVSVFKNQNKHKNKIKPPVETPHVAATPENRFKQTVKFVFDHKISTIPNLENPRSPEFKAAQFMSGGDGYNLTPGDDFFGDQGQRFLERYILALFYYQTGGLHWNDNYNFLMNIDHCKWNKRYTTPAGTFIRGVQCNEDGFIVDMDLSNNNLDADSIPYEVKGLKHLEKLHLFGNPLRGRFPDILEMKSLKSIGFMKTEISGTIPNGIGYMSQLTTLALGGTKMGPQIPRSMSSLKNLRILGLDGLGLVGGIKSLLHLTKLEALYLEDNHLSGDLTDQKWTNMKELDLSNNIITGAIPDSMMQNTNLQVLDLNNNDFWGIFPTEIFTNDAMQYLNIHNNRFMGTLSDRIGFLKNLKHLDVSKNLLEGTLPDTIGLLSHLVSLNTSGNSFKRQRLGNFYAQLSNLQELSMKGNMLTGTLPEYLANFHKLKLLDLDGNQLKGTISTYIGILNDLQALMLNRNFLSGTIPSELNNLNKLSILLLDGNNLKGKTTELCRDTKPALKHFVTDCYPSMLNEDGPEVECRCCTLCCNDENTNCNNKDWSSSYDPKSHYGFIRTAFDFSLDQAPEGWQKKAIAEAHQTSRNEQTSPPT